jgi:hypothetical protein
MRLARTRKALIETPFEVLIFAVFVIDGIYQLFHGVKASPSTVITLLPYWLLVAWQATLVVGGTVGLVGRLRASWQIERAGLAMIGPAAFAYGMAIVFETGTRGLVAASIDLMIGTAFLIRYRVLGQAARIVEAQHRALS